MDGVYIYEVMGMGVGVASATLLPRLLCAATTSISNQAYSHNHTS